LKPKLLASALLSLLATAPAAGGQQTFPRARTPLYAWVQLAADDHWLVRAVYPATTRVCPAPTRVRAMPDAAFPVLVCEARLPRTTAAVTVAGRRYVRPRRDPGTIAVVGDTGCRVKQTQVQECDEAAAWPFARVADRIAATRPGLVVHVGDYYYREACPEDAPGCAGGGPTGDTWASWEADFFRPAASLLRAAPWAFARGNHENCDRGGEGWFRLLDPAERPSYLAAACSTFTPAYAIHLAGLDLLMLDSGCAPAGAWCLPNDSVRLAGYTREVESLKRLAGSTPSWLVTHTPLWAVSNPGGDSTGTASLQAAVRAVGLPASVRMVLSGHVHLFQSLGFAGARPPQIVAGNGGTALDVPAAPPTRGRPMDGIPLEAYSSSDAFGYSTAQRIPGGWTVTMHPVEGGAPLTCRVVAMRSTCTTP
jgi:hypothetical protein